MKMVTGSLVPCPPDKTPIDLFEPGGFRGLRHSHKALNLAVTGPRVSSLCLRASGANAG
jgi:hypothetical protein